MQRGLHVACGDGVLQATLQRRFDLVQFLVNRTFRCQAPPDVDASMVRESAQLCGNILREARTIQSFLFVLRVVCWQLVAANGALVAFLQPVFDAVLVIVMATWDAQG